VRFILAIIKNGVKYTNRTNFLFFCFMWHELIIGITLIDLAAEVTI